MTETLMTWSVAECPFTIESSPRVLDDIRLAVTDAFFSLPRGGAEIGGILLGAFEGNCLTISAYAPLDCEHAYGPSFTLSAPDEARLTELLASNSGGGLRPVGWYHSHTRSEIFLSDADVEIHRRFFPEPWQVALVIKPHTFQPARIGFFFSEADGTIHASASYREEVLDALPVRQMPAGPPAAPAANEPRPRNLRQPEASGPVVEILPERAAEPSAPTFTLPFNPPPLHSPEIGATISPALTMTPPAPPLPLANPTDLVSALAHSNPTPVATVSVADAPVAPAAELATPKFVIESESSARKWMVATIGIIAVVGILGAGFKTRQMWLPRVLSAARPAGPATPAAPPALGLNTIDRAGQLQINWDRNSQAVRSAADALLEINEGGPVPTAIQLDAAHLQTGSFTYARTADKVDVKLILHHKNGPDLREATSFLGKLPEHKADPEAEKQRDEAAKLKADLVVQTAKTKKLENDVQAIREEMRQQQQRRLANQAPDK